MSTHNCPNIIFHCIDFRLIKETMIFINEKYGIGKCDIVSVAGSGKEIADDNEIIKNYLLKQIKISHDLHESRKVVLIHHSDCGAYNNCYQFNSQEEEKQKQIEDMKKAEVIIKEILSDVSVEKVWAQMLDPHGNKVDFIIID
ncbi:MAG: carbonic anhydrase [Candidatus Paceibacterota bacterium]